jgi:hypothetical protein
VTVEIAANPHGMGYTLMIAQQSLDPALMRLVVRWPVDAVNAARCGCSAVATRAVGFDDAPVRCPVRMSSAEGRRLVAQVGRQPAIGSGVFLPTPEATWGSLVEGVVTGELIGSPPPPSCAGLGGWRRWRGSRSASDRHRLRCAVDRPDAEFVRRRRVGGDAAGDLDLRPSGGMVPAVAVSRWAGAAGHRARHGGGTGR